MLPKYSDYVKHCDGETKWINFLIKDDDLLKKYISNKVSNSIKKELFENQKKVLQSYYENSNMQS